MFREEISAGLSESGTTDNLEFDKLGQKAKSVNYDTIISGLNTPTPICSEMQLARAAFSSFLLA